MSVSAGQVDVKLNLDKRRFEQGMNEARKSVDLFSGVLSSIAALGTSAVLLNIGKAALKASSDFEQAQVQFGVMLNSAEKANKLVNEIQTMANVTPFETQDLLNASKLLLNFGISLDEVMPDLQMLGDIAGGDKAKMQALTLAFSQMSSAGKLMGQDLLQMINAGFNPLQQMSEKTGKSIGELKDEMSKGAITVDMVRQSFIEATSEGGRFYGMMNKQSETLQGKISTLSDAYTILTRSISDLALPAIKEQVSNLTVLVNKTNEQITTIKQWASVNQSTVFGIQNAVVAIAALAAGIPVTSKAVTGLITAYKNLGVVTASTTVYQRAFANLLKGNATLALIQYRTAVQATIAQVKALTVALLANPVTWVTVALGAGAVAWWNYQQSIHATANAIEELNGKQQQETDETVKAIKTLKELNGVSNLNVDQQRQLRDAIDYLTEKYPNYIGKLKEELRLKGEISRATAEQIANEATLAKVKELTERKAKIDKKVNEGVTAYKQSQLMSSARFGTAVNTGDTGRLGVSKSLRRDQDRINKELEDVKNERQAIVNELTSLGKETSGISGVNNTVTPKNSGSKKTSKQQAKEEKDAKKEAVDYAVAQLEVEKYQTQKTDDEIYQINLKQIDAKLAAEKEGTSAYAQLLAEKYRLEQEYAKQKKSLEAQKVSDDLTYAKQDVDNQIAQLEIAYDSNKISKTQMLRSEIELINKKKQLEEAALAEQLKLVEGNAAEEVKIKRASLKTLEEYNLEANRKTVELMNYQRQAYSGFFDDVSSGWGSTVADLLNGEMTFADALTSVLDTVLDSFGDMCGNMVEQWLKDHMTMENITKLFGIQKIATDKLIQASNTLTSTSNTGLAGSYIAQQTAQTELTTTTGLLTGANTLLSTETGIMAATQGVAAAETTAASGTMASGVTAILAPVTALASAMAALAGSTSIVALDMAVIALSTGLFAIEAALASMTGLLLSASFGILAATSQLAAGGMAALAVATAAESAAMIPLVGWAIAPEAAISTGASIAAGTAIAGFMENGGDVKKGQAYIVGEKQPELFIPDRNGRIEPNLDSLNGGGGGSVTNYQTSVTIQAIDTKDFKQRVGELTGYIHGNLQSGIKKRQLASLGGSK